MAFVHEYITILLLIIVVILFPSVNITTSLASHTGMEGVYHQDVGFRKTVGRRGALTQSGLRANAPDVSAKLFKNARWPKNFMYLATPRHVVRCGTTAKISRAPYNLFMRPVAYQTASQTR